MQAISISNSYISNTVAKRDGGAVYSMQAISLTNSYIAT